MSLKIEDIQTGDLINIKTNGDEHIMFCIILFHEQNDTYYVLDDEQKSVLLISLSHKHDTNLCV
jgi:hypothetical protein